jgi:excisionase family DNA binding protein
MTGPSSCSGLFRQNWRRPSAHSTSYPFNDESGDATLWLPAQRAVRPSGAPTIGRTTSPPKEKEPLLLTIVQAAGALSVGRSTAYEMIARGDLDVVHLGRAVRVPVRAVEELVDGLRDRPDAV